MTLLNDLLERARSLLSGIAPAWQWTPELEPVDADEVPVIEVDHTSDDPGPETVSRGELQRLDAEA